MAVTSNSGPPLARAPVKVCHPYGVNLALVRHAFIERLLEELNYWKVSTSDLNSLDIPLWKKRRQSSILDAILGFSDSTLRLSFPEYQFKTLFSEMIVGECVQEHSHCI